MADRHRQAPSAPPISAMSHVLHENLMSYGSAREGTELHLQQLSREQRDLGSQIQEYVSRLVGVNQQLADSVRISDLFEGGKAQLRGWRDTRDDKLQKALVLAEEETNSLKEDVQRLESQRDALQRQLHRATTSNLTTSTSHDQTLFVQLQDELARANRLVRTKETLLAAMMSELDSVKGQLCDARSENERLSEMCQNMSGPLAGSLQLPLVTRFTDKDFVKLSETVPTGASSDDQADGNGKEKSEKKKKTSPTPKSEQELFEMVKKKDRQMAEVVKINRDWERKYTRLKHDLDAYRQRGERKSGSRDESRDALKPSRKSQRHSGELSPSDLQDELEASRRAATLAQERCKLLEQKLREKQRILLEETEQHQLAWAEKESLEEHMKDGRSGDSRDQVRRLQQQLDNLRKELQTSMRSEARVREELAASQAAVSVLRQHMKGGGDIDLRDLPAGGDLSSTQDRITALESQVRLGKEECRREQKDKQRLGQELAAMRIQLQQLLQPNATPTAGRGTATLFTGQHAELDDTVPEAHLEPRSAGSIDIVCEKCSRHFDHRGKFLTHMQACRTSD